MIKSIRIQNYKSIVGHTIELGRTNVFIGENGCGKTNILEALGMAGAALTNKLSIEELFSRGLRVGMPSITKSSFPGGRQKEILVRITLPPDHVGTERSTELQIVSEPGTRRDFKWVRKTKRDGLRFNFAPETMSLFMDAIPDLVKAGRLIKADRHRDAELATRGVLAKIQPQELAILAQGLKEILDERANSIDDRICSLIGEYAIYTANPLALRGMQTISRRAPLGIFGETLDVAISQLTAEARQDVLTRAKCISWVKDIAVCPKNEHNSGAHKLGRSQSELYFSDRHMRRIYNTFSAENVNEGVLHLLFYLTLFASDGTPKVFGIDNIDTALNPQLCRSLVVQVVELSKKYGKQSLITTHNPAVLDGLNLHDDEQRLFVVSRNDQGHTVARRIRLKPQSRTGNLKLSEMWMRGLLGGLPEGF